MPRIYTINDVGNSDGSKLGSPPSNRYPPSRLELEEQLKKDRKEFIRSAKQLLTKYHVLDEKNKCIQNDLDHSHEENERMQNDLDNSHEENERMHNSINQIAPLANQLNSLNNKLVSQITCERKSHTTLNAKQLKEIESLRSMVKSLESIISSMQKASSADKIQILSLETKIHELEGKLEDIDLERIYHDLDVKGGEIEEPVEIPKLPDWLHDNLRSIVCELGLEDKVIELDKKLAKDDILEVLQKVLSEKDYRLQDANTRLERALSEKDSILHEANARIKKHLTNFEKKTNPDSFETQVIGGSDISNTTLALPHLHSITGLEAGETISFFFQHAIIFVTVLLIIYFLWRISSYLYSFISPHLLINSKPENPAFSET